MIIVHQKKDYLLQKSKATRRLNTEFAGIEVEGTIMDALLATTSYLVKSNPMIYECLAGIPIYQTVYSQKLMELWQKSYNWEVIRHAVHGMLKGYKLKKLFVDKNDSEMTTCKLACESVYLGLKLLFIAQNWKTPPVFDFNTLLQEVSG